MAAHVFDVTGGYDPERDGPLPQWGRLAVKCRACGETRRIWRGLPLTDPGLTWGCPVTRIAAGTITAAKITAWTPAPYPLAQPATPQPFAAAPELGVLLAEARHRHRALTLVSLALIALGAFMVACVTTGRWPSLATFWGAAMVDAGLITWGVLAFRRPPPGLGSGHGQQPSGGVPVEPGGGDSRLR